MKRVNYWMMRVQDYAYFKKENINDKSSRQYFLWNMLLTRNKYFFWKAVRNIPGKSAVTACLARVLRPSCCDDTTGKISSLP